MGAAFLVRTAFALFLLIHKFLAVLHNDSAESVANLLTGEVEYLVAQSSLTSSDIADAVGTTAYELESVAAELALRIEGIISLASFHVEGDIAKGGTVLSLTIGVLKDVVLRHGSFVDEGLGNNNLFTKLVGLLLLLVGEACVLIVELHGEKVVFW